MVIIILRLVFLPLLLSDKLTFIKSDKLTVDTNSDILNKLKDNLILKAIRLLEKQTNKKIFIRNL